MTAVKTVYHFVTLLERSMEKAYLAAYSVSNLENDFNIYMRSICLVGEAVLATGGYIPEILGKGETRDSVLCVTDMGRFCEGLVQKPCPYFRVLLLIL